MGLLLLVPGLVLDFAGSRWFSGASTVGLILTIVGGALIAFQLIFFLVVAGAVVGNRKR